MPTNPKQESLVIWMVIGVVVLLGYPLSLGPLQKVVVDYGLPNWLYTLHQPLLWVANNGPKDMTRPYWIYLNFWVSDWPW